MQYALNNGVVVAALVCGLVLAWWASSALWSATDGRRLTADEALAAANREHTAAQAEYTRLQAQLKVVLEQCRAVRAQQAERERQADAAHRAQNAALSFARWQEREEARVAAEAAAARLEDRQTRFNEVRDALVWLRHLAPHIDAYAVAHAEEILRERPAMAARYHDPKSPFLTADRCVKVARWFLLRFPAEASHLLPEQYRTPEALGQVLRQFHGREIEQLVPKALAHVLRDALPPDCSTEVADPSDPMSAVPPADRVRFQELLRDVRSFAALQEVAESERRRYEAQLRDRQPPLSDEALHHAVEKYAANLAAATETWAAEHNLAG